MIFSNRHDAGIQLADALKDVPQDNLVVLALPRGGVELGLIVSERLNASLDLVIPRKIGHPSHEEYAIGAISEDGTFVKNLEANDLDEAWLQAEIEKQTQEALRRRELYCDGKEMIDIADKTVVIVDDGIATGLTMQAAISHVQSLGPKEIIVAIPVVPNDVADMLKEKVDNVVALDIPTFYKGAVGAYYKTFGQVSDEEVMQHMHKAQSS